MAAPAGSRSEPACVCCSSQLQRALSLLAVPRSSKLSLFATAALLPASPAAGSSKLSPTSALTPSRRQLPCYSRPLPPPELKNHLTPEKYKKAQAYSRDKTYYSIANHVFSFVQSLIFIKGGYLWTWNFAGRIMDALGLSRDRMVGCTL